MVVVERHTLRTDVDLAVYIALPRGNGKYPTVVICHGIPAGPRIPGDVGYLKVIEDLASRGYACVFFNFRGVGESGGEFNYSLWLNDLGSIVDFTCNQGFTDTGKLCIVGFSGGAIVALHHTVHDGRVKALVLGACPAVINSRKFKTILEYARKYRTLRGIENLNMDKTVKILREMEPIKWISKVSPRPLLIIHGGNDELFPVSHALILFEKAEQPKKLEVIPNATHRLRIHREVLDTIDIWLREVWST